MVYKKILVAVLCVFVVIAGVACNNGETAPQDASAFPFNDKSTVGYGYGYNEMMYPFEDSRNYVQLYAAQSESDPAQFTYSVNGSLTVRIEQGVQGSANVCMRIYSMAFDGREPGEKVKVKMLINVDPQLSPGMYLAHNGPNGEELSNQTRIPKAGTLTEMSVTTAIETSAGYYRNNLNCGNRNNVMMMFVRLSAGEEFTIDSIDFEFGA